jgi:hypothetical protein
LAACSRHARYPQRADEPKPFSSARQRADRLLGDIAPRIPRVTLEISGLPEGVLPEVTWDGQPLDPAKIGGYLEANPGPHRVQGVARGFPDVTRDVKLAEGQALLVVLAFSRAPQLTAAGSPAKPAPAPPASGSVVRPGKPTLFWVGLGVAATGIVAGSATGAYSLSRTSRAKRHCEEAACTAAAQPDIDRAKTFANVSNVAFAVGVAGLGVAAWQFFTHRAPQKESAQPHVSARVSAGGVWLDGTF